MASADKCLGTPEAPLSGFDRLLPATEEAGAAARFPANDAALGVTHYTGGPTHRTGAQLTCHNVITLQQLGFAPLISCMRQTVEPNH